MTRLRLAVFDVDGTLVDSEHNIITAMTEAWRRIGLGIPQPTQIRRIIGLSLIEACAMLLPWASPATHRAVAEAYKDAFKALRLLPDSLEPLFPGVESTLTELKSQGWRLGLATGKSRGGVETMLQGHGLEGCFDTIQTADNNPSKPNPTMLLRAAAEVGADPAGMVMIGDTTYDMMMASAAKVAGLGVSWGCHTLEDLNAAGARLVVDSFDGLGDILATVMKAPPCA